MGIEGLFAFFRGIVGEDEESVIKLCEFSALRGKKAAFDVSGTVHAHYSIAAKVALKAIDLQQDYVDTMRLTMDNACINSMINYFISMMNTGCYPVVVFDGEKPKSKKIAHDKRDKTKLRNEERLSKLFEEFDNIEPIDRTQKMINELKTLMASSSKPSPGFYDRFYQLLSSTGIPCIKSRYESDIVCATLAKMKIVDVVISKDGDMLAHGSPLVVTDTRVMAEGERCIKYIYLDDVLTLLGMDYKQFRDFCIYCGCDYGPGVPGCRAKTLFKLYKECGSISAMIEKYETKYDFENALYSKCRKEFSTKKLKNIVARDYELNEELIRWRGVKFDKSCKSILKDMGLGYRYASLKSAINSLVKHAPEDFPNNDGGSGGEDFD